MAYPLAWRRHAGQELHPIIQLRGAGGAAGGAFDSQNEGLLRQHPHEGQVAVCAAGGVGLEVADADHPVVDHADGLDELAGMVAGLGFQEVFRGF